MPGVLILEAERRDMGFSPSVEDADLGGTEALCRAGRIDGCVPSPDDNYCTLYSRPQAQLVVLDETERVNNAGVIPAEEC